MNPSRARDGATADVLVIDSSDAAARAVIKTLPETKTITVSEQRSGADALAWLDRCGAPPKVILLSLRLQDIDGLEVLRAIRANLRTTATPVIVLSGSDHEQHRAAAIQLGVNGFCPDTEDEAVLTDRFQFFKHFVR